MISDSEYNKHNVYKDIRCAEVKLALECLSLFNSLVVSTTSKNFKPNTICEIANGDKTRRLNAPSENL